MKNYTNTLLYMPCDGSQKNNIGWYSTIFLLLLGGFVPATSFGQLNVVPQFLFFNEPARSQECVVRNPSDQAVETSIEFRFGFPLMDDSGKVVMVYKDSSNEGPESAVHW